MGLYFSSLEAEASNQSLAAERFKAKKRLTCIALRTQCHHIARVCVVEKKLTRSFLVFLFLHAPLLNEDVQSVTVVFALNHHKHRH